MKTMCPCDDCNQKYKIRSDLLGSMARCKKCNTVFKVEEYTPAPPIIELTLDDENQKEVEDSSKKKKRKSPTQVMEENLAKIKREILDFIPRLETSLERQDNESDTRLLLDRIFQRILGFTLDDIKTEQKIEGRRADYVLSINGEDVIVIEVKRIGMNLREKQIFQATSYGAYSGIKWALLTNAVVWQLYHISTGEKIEHNLVFSIDLRDGLDDEEVQQFYLISKAGMSRKKLLDNTWKKMSALCYDNIVNAILNEQVVSKIRTVLNKENKVRLTDDDVRSTIEANIFQLD